MNRQWIFPILAWALPLVSLASINPDRSIHDFLEILSKDNVINGEVVSVRMKQYSDSGMLSRSNKRAEIPLEDYKSWVKTASAVFEMIPKVGDADEMQYKGSAFHIGNSLVLTNHHVLSRNFSNSTRCDKFQITDHERKVWDCKKVHFCSTPQDTCLIELDRKNVGMPWSPRWETFANKPKLKITMSLEPADNNVPLLAIGNSQGHGIHLSQGRGLVHAGDQYKIYASVRDGNSGGPVVDQDGLVIGIVRTESVTKVGPTAHNTAAPTRNIIPLIREALQNDPETLEKFNLAVVE